MDEILENHESMWLSEDRIKHYLIHYIKYNPIKSLRILVGYYQTNRFTRYNSRRS